LKHDGRFLGIVVIADSLTQSEIRANANFYIARAHDDEEDRMTFQSHNPATGELIGTYPEHDEAETNVRLQRAWEGRKECSPEHDAGDECHHPLHEAASPFPDPAS
jgi:hypothetical protein